MICAGVITFSGIRLARVAERLAEITGLGQAIIGAVCIGISTSLAGSVLSCAAAYKGHPELALSNALGGLPAQTMFLAIADITYRRVNIEHAAASLENLAQGTLLFILLSIVLLAGTLPGLTVFAIHPVTVVLILAYICSLKLIHHMRDNPMWKPRQTLQTQKEEKEEGDKNERIARDNSSPSQTISAFLILAALLGMSGYILAETAVELSSRTFLSQTLIGGLMTSIATSLPELVTTLAAVRRKALNLAVGNIIGGNSFDVLFVAGADIFFRDGSIYHHMNNGHIMITTTAMLMTGILILGLLRRQKKGPAGMGFESVLISACYVMLVINLVYAS